MIILETMDYNMLSIIENDPHNPKFSDPPKDGSSLEMKLTLQDSWSEDDKKLINLDVCARDAIVTSHPYEIYHLM